MSNHTMRPRVIATLAALTLCPTVALAQAGSAAQGVSPSGETSGNIQRQGMAQQGMQGTKSGPSAADPSPPKETPGNIQRQGMAQQGKPGTESGPSAAPSGTGSAQNRASNTAQTSRSQQGIDPSEIQKVFGTSGPLVDLNALDAEGVRRLQTTLSERGYYRGTVDGVMGSQTRAALNAALAAQYALNRKLINRGQLSEQMAESLGMGTAGVARVSGSDDRTTHGQPQTTSSSGPRRDSSSGSASQAPSGSRSSSSATGNSGNNSQTTGSSSDAKPAPR
jgi:hypothetical protein